MLNFIKKAFDNLSGSTEQTSQALREALEKTRNFLAERDGVFVKSSHPSPEFAATTDISITPGKGSAELRLTVTPVKGGEAARVEATHVFDSGTIKGPAQLAEAIDETIDLLRAQAVKELSAKGIVLFEVTYDTFIDAVKSLRLKPFRELDDLIGVTIPASKELKTAWPLHIKTGTKHFTLSVEMNGVDTTAAKQFENRGIKAEVSDKRLTASKTCGLEAITSTDSLASAIKQYIDNVGQVLADINRHTPLSAATFSRGIDAEFLRKRLSTLETFSSIDSDGDVKLVIPADDNFVFPSTVWILPRSEKVTVQIRGTIDKEFKDDGAVQKLWPGIKIDVSDGKTRGLELRVTPADLRKDDKPQNLQLFDAVQGAITNLRYAWVKVHDLLNVPCHICDFFDKKKIEQLLRKMGHEMTKDDAGDIRLTIQADKDCPMERFLWVMTSPEKIKISGGVFGSPSNLDVEKCAADATANLKGTGYTAYVYKNTVRLRGCLEAASISFMFESDRDEAIVKFVRKSIDTIKTACAEPIRIYLKNEAEERARKETVESIRREVVKFGQTMGYEMKTDDDGDIKLSVPSDKTFDSKRFIWVIIKSDRVEVRGSINQYPDNIDNERIAADATARFKGTPFIAKIVKNGAVWVNGTIEINISTEASNRNKAVIDFVRDGIDKIKIACAEPLRILKQREEDERKRREEEERKKREEEERKKREEEERKKREEQERRAREEANRRAERERNLGKWMEYSINASCTVGEVQKYFNGIWPYLRICFFMVGHGQTADRTGSELTPIDRDCQIGKIRSFKSSSTIRIEGRSTPDDIEKAFRKQTGLVVKICYTDDSKHRYYISKKAAMHKKPIGDLNTLFDSNGYYYNDWY